MKVVSVVLLVVFFFWSCDDLTKKEASNSQEKQHEVNQKETTVGVKNIKKKRIIETCKSRKKKCTRIEMVYPQLDVSDDLNGAFARAQVNDMLLSTVLFSESVVDVDSGIDAFFERYDHYVKESGDAKPWFIKVKIKVAYRKQDTLTLLLKKTVMETQDDPIVTLDIRTFNLATHEILTLESLAKEESKLLPVVEKYFRKKTRMKPDATWESKGYWFEQFELTNNIGIVGDDVVFVYGHDPFIPPKKGNIEVKVPLRDLRSRGLLLF